jgi:hypothetical protein
MAEPKAWTKVWQKTSKKYQDQSKLNPLDHKPFFKAETFWQCKYVTHTYVLTYFTFAVTYVVNACLFKYFKYAKA